MNNLTAILLFSQSASADAGLHWAGSFGQAAVGERMIQRAEKLCRSSGLDYFRSDETTQFGETFGQRLSHAIQSVFAQGYQRLIVVGNDCPQLRASDLRKCKKMLQSGRNVIGPDRRGGVYLLGLQASGFEADVLATLSWQRTELLPELDRVLPKTSRLRSLHDLNEIGELKRLMPWLSGDSIWATIHCYLTGCRIEQYETFIGTSAGSCLSVGLRAPPC